MVFTDPKPVEQINSTSNISKSDMFKKNVYQISALLNVYKQFYKGLSEGLETKFFALLVHKHVKKQENLVLLAFRKSLVKLLVDIQKF